MLICLGIDKGGRIKRRSWVMEKAIKTGETTTNKECPAVIIAGAVKNQFEGEGINRGQNPCAFSSESLWLLIPGRRQEAES